MNSKEYLEKYLPKEKLEEGLKLLEQGLPVQYIVGNVDFYGYIYDINSNVLIPRFETEELVNKTINYINKYFNKKLDIIDLGTGSGCIAVTLKNEIECNMTAVDISIEALEVAKKNANKYKQSITFINSDMLDKVTGKFDVIISNPPYISIDEEIMDIVKNNEPHLALYAENEGLFYYEDILSKANKYLNEKSIIAFEIGCWQGEKIKKLALNYLPNSTVVIEKDMQDKDRFIFIFTNLENKID